MSFRGGGSSRPGPHRASLPGKRRLNGRGAENGRRTRRGTRPRSSARPPAAGLPASQWGRVRRATPPRAATPWPFRAHSLPRPPPHRGTCTARLRKVPASAASFFTLKSMMFILGGSREKLPADLAGRRRGRAGAPGESGLGRRGRWREAAPAPPPQLSFPWRGSERVGRGRERAPRGGPRAREVAAAETHGLLRREWGVSVDTSSGGRAGHWRTGIRRVGRGLGRRKLAPAAGWSLFRGYRGNSDPFWIAAAQSQGAPEARLAAREGKPL